MTVVSLVFMPVECVPIGWRLHERPSSVERQTKLRHPALSSEYETSFIDTRMVPSESLPRLG